MKTKEELNAIKEEVENLNKKLAELSEEELLEVTGGELVFDPDDESLLPDDEWCRYNCKSFVFNTLNLNAPMSPKYCANSGKSGICYYEKK